MPKKLSEEHKKKIALRQVERMKNPALRFRISAAMKGNKHRLGKGTVFSMPYLKKEAKIRDNYTCQVCGLYDKEILVIDHIKPRSKFPEFVNVLDNLVTLCPNCHMRKTIRNREF